MRAKPLSLSFLRTDAGSSPFEGLTTGNYKRCPGAASQPNVDGSATWRDSDGKLDCDPSLVLPGP